MAIPILTVSEPVFDKNGKLVYVVAFSINEKLTEEIFQEMAHSRLQSADLLNFFSNKISDQEEIIAESQPIRDILKSLSKAASMESTILLTGETGVGKKLLWFIHIQPSAQGIIYFRKCAAIPKTSLNLNYLDMLQVPSQAQVKTEKQGFFRLPTAELCFDEIENCPVNTS